MTDKETGGPTFPAQFFDERATGMTLRDYFAAKAMVVLMAEKDGPNDDCPGSPRFECTGVALIAYEQADAMLEARK
jgi:hypothetical protein